MPNRGSQLGLSFTEAACHSPFGRVEPVWAEAVRSLLSHSASCFGFAPTLLLSRLLGAFLPCRRTMRHATWITPSRFGTHSSKILSSRFSVRGSRRRFTAAAHSGGVSLRRSVMAKLCHMARCCAMPPSGSTLCTVLVTVIESCWLPLCE